MSRESRPGVAGESWLGAFDDQVRMTRVRRRAMVAIGLGEFVDAYDLIVISGLFFALGSHFRLSGGEVRARAGGRARLAPQTPPPGVTGPM